MKHLFFSILLITVSLSVNGVSAQTTAPNVPVLNASRAEDIRVDATLDEPAWANADVASGFIQQDPTEGAPATEKTEVKVLYGDASLYIGAVLYDDPAQIRTPLNRRDAPNDTDWFMILIDSDNDRRSTFEFLASPANVQFDAVYNDRNGEDNSWDAVWTSATRITDEGWVVEMEIPFSQLRFSPGATSFGLNFLRSIDRKGERVWWAPFTREQEQAGTVQYYGRLNGLEGLNPRRVLQATPYSLGRMNRYTPEDATDATTDVEADIGADLKVGLASNVTLDATINPDFGQVDADPSELNLSTFETFFDERRPFFLEGTQIFDLAAGNGRLLYTRRIGETAPIIAATKITGRTAGGLSFGALGAATGDDFDPSQLYGATRVKQELGGQGYLGGGATLFSDWQDSLAVTSAAVGGDWDVRLGGNDEWQLVGTATGTYQDRPDTDPFGYAVFAELDRVKGYVTPYAGFRLFSDSFELNDVGRLSQNDLIVAWSGANILWNRSEPVGPFRRLETNGNVVTGFRYSDLTHRGFSGVIDTWGQFHGFEEIEFNFNVDDLGGHDARETRGLGIVENVGSVTAEIEFRTDSRKKLSAYAEFETTQYANGGERYEPRLGLDWTVNNHLSLSFDGELSFVSNRRAWVANEAFVRTGNGLLIGDTPGAPDQLSAEQFTELALSQAQADALFDGLESFGNHPIAGGTAYYQPIFASRDTRSASLTTRANVLFTPKLSLQLYGQLFAARGHYNAFSLLAAPDELRPFDSYPRPHDFAFSTFNLNTVLRWEYRPGSTLYVVWTQARDVDDSPFGLAPPPDGSPYDTSTFDQFGDTFGAFSDNVFLIKLSYLLMR